MNKTEQEDLLDELTLLAIELEDFTTDVENELMEQYPIEIVKTAKKLLLKYSGYIKNIENIFTTLNKVHERRVHSFINDVGLDYVLGIKDDFTLKTFYYEWENEKLGKENIKLEKIK